MKKEFVPYEQASALKELGFNEPCIAYWQGGENKEPTMMCNQGTIYVSQYSYFNNTIEGKIRGILVSSPLYQQALRWFREKYRLQGHIECDGGTEFPCHRIIITDKNVTEISDNTNLEIYSSDEYGAYHTYEEAELECLKKLIQLVSRSKQ